MHCPIHSNWDYASCSADICTSVEYELPRNILSIISFYPNHPFIRVQDSFCLVLHLWDFRTLNCVSISCAHYLIDLEPWLSYKKRFSNLFLEIAQKWEKEVKSVCTFSNLISFASVESNWDNYWGEKVEGTKLHFCASSYVAFILLWCHSFECNFHSTGSECNYAITLLGHKPFTLRLWG